MKNVVLATSFWDQVDPVTGHRRESELMASEQFWGQMIAKGSKVTHLGDRHQNSQVLEMMSTYKPVILHAQDEMVNQGKNVARTGAAQVTAADIEAEKKKHRELKQKMQRDMEEKARKQEEAHRHEMERLKRETEERTRRMEEERRRREEEDRRWREETQLQAKEYNRQMREERRRQEEEEETQRREQQAREYEQQQYGWNAAREQRFVALYQRFCPGSMPSGYGPGGRYYGGSYFM